MRSIAALAIIMLTAWTTVQQDEEQMKRRPSARPMGPMEQMEKEEAHRRAGSMGGAPNVGAGMGTGTGAGSKVGNKIKGNNERVRQE